MASFSIKDGSPDSGPVFNGIDTYEVKEENGKIYVKIPKKLKHITPIKAIEQDPNNKTKYVIIGGGPSALSAAETLRQSGFTGIIEIYTDENYKTYDRTILTKNIHGANYEGLKVRNEEYLKLLNINFHTNNKVKKIHKNEKLVELENGQKINYNKVLIATGLRPNIPKIEGINAEGIFTIKNLEDVLKIKENKNIKNLIIYGGNFIGLETASSFKNQFKEDINITIISKDKIHENFGKESSEALKNLALENNINIIENMTINKINKDGNKIKSVQLNNGNILNADSLVLGLGSIPNSSDFDVKKNDLGYIEVDSMLRTLDNKDILACGDVAHTPFLYPNSKIYCKHYSDAISQGSYAAWNMLNKFVPVDYIPFFWTRVFNKSYSVVGFLDKYDNIISYGNPKEYNFINFYFKNKKLVAASGMGKSHELIIINQAMKLNLNLNENEFASNYNIEKIKKEIESRGRECNCSRKSNSCK